MMQTIRVAIIPMMFCIWVRIYDARRKEMVRKKRKVGIKQRSSDEKFTIRPKHYWQMRAIKEYYKVSITLRIG
jgi:hypothetical protein